jgi:hypothetical protein
MLLKRVTEVVTKVVLGLPPASPFRHLLERSHPFVIQDLHSRWIYQAIEPGAENEAKKVHELKPRLPVRASLDTRDILYRLACKEIFKYPRAVKGSVHVCLSKLYEELYMMSVEHSFMHVCRYMHFPSKCKCHSFAGSESHLRS